jgi:zinc metalloprotease ZmpA
MSLRRAVVLTAAGALISASIAAVALPAQAQPPSDVAQSPQAMAANAATDLVASRPAALHASASDSFAQQKVYSSHGLQYVSYDRTYKGLPVVGGDFVVVTNQSGQVLNTSVAQDQTINLASTTPKLTSAQAEAIARGQSSNVDSVGNTRLVAFALGTPALAWETTVIGRDAEGPSKLTVVVDAATGAVLHTQEHVMHGTGTSGFNGPNPITVATTQSGSTFLLRDPAHPTVQAQNATGNTTFSGADDVWGNGDSTNRETGGLDALFAAETEERMLTQWLGRNSFDGNGGGWPIRIGLNDLNAFYDGTQVQIGHNQQNQWISSIDVVAHELGHGIDDHTPGGISGGGTQEFVADVFGASTEWFANEPAQFDGPDFLVGEKINLVGSGPIRNMFNPSQVNNDPNCWSTAIPNTEVHKAAGPGNHWFYLTAMGSNPTNGQPTSPTCNGSTVTGIGVQAAVTIFYNAMLMKTAGFSYLRYRTATLTAAKNLTPGNCTNFNTVKAAWDAVSVPAQAGDPTCTPTGNAPVVNNPGNQTGTVGTAVSLQLTATGGTPPLHWTATGLPAGLSVSDSGLISGTPTTAGTSSVTVTARDSANPAQSGSASFQWTINPVGGGCSSPGQKLGNPGFEVGSAPWTATANVIGAFAGQTAHSGTRFAWMDGYGTTHTDTLSQTVTIPAGCRASLQFWLHIDTAETTTATQFDRLTVQLNATTVATFSNLNRAAGYQLRTFDVSSFAGQTVTLKFTGTEDISLQTSFVVDDTALNVS